MEFLQGEVEARYAFDTAADVARREIAIRATTRTTITTQTPPPQSTPITNMVRDFRDAREALRVTQPAGIQGRFTPPYGWHSAWAAHQAMLENPDYSEEAYLRAFTVNSAHQLHLMLSGRRN
jgi:hypothetical protein